MNHTLTQISHTENRHTVQTGLGARARSWVDTLIRGLVLNRDGRRAIIVRKAFFDAAKLVTPSIAMQRDGVWYYVDTHDHVISRATFAYGSYEEDVMGEALGILQAHGHTVTGRTFVDVGANIGTSTIAALINFGARDAIAIEPAPTNYRLLRCNVIANDLEDRVRTVRAAASAEPGSGALALSSWNSGDHRVSTGNGSSPTAALEPRRSIDVPTVRLDDVLESHGVEHGDIGLVWMDTQGHEPFVLAGARELMRSDVPVIVEYWPQAVRGSGGLELMHSLIAEHYDLVVDVRAAAAGEEGATLPAAEVGKLEARYPDWQFTDLVLLTQR